MKAKVLLVAIWILCNYGSVALAGILIESVDDSGAPTKVRIEGEHARIDGNSNDFYMLLNLKDGTVYAVSDNEGIVVNLSASPTRQSVHSDLEMAEAQLPRATVEKVGPGPTVSGQKTTRYRVSIAGTRCFDEYLASEPLQIAPLRRFLEVMASASNQTESLMAALLAADEPNLCEAAGDDVDDQYQALGIPMRTVLADGSITHEITHIDLTATIDTADLVLPSAYPVLSREELRKQQTERSDPDAIAPTIDQIMERQRRIEEDIQRLDKDPDGPPGQ
jgi:hypothetical protein